MVQTWGGEKRIERPWIFLVYHFNKMAVISQMRFSDTFLWMKSFVFRSTFHWSLLIRFQLTMNQHCFRWWLGTEKATGHYLNQCWPDSYMRNKGELNQWLAPVRRQTIACTNANMWSTGPQGRKFSEIWIKTLWFFFARFLFKMLFAKLWPFSSRTAHSKTKQISGSWIPKFPLKWHFEISRAVTHNEEAASFSTGSFDI